MVDLNRNKIILSIIIPTLNRRDLLEITLEYLIEQLGHAAVSVELIVSDNASNDDTKELFMLGGRFEKTVKYVRFDKRVDIDTSFKRSIELANGKFINLFGDDDLPLPGYIQEITKKIKESPEIGLFYVNRIIGNEKLNSASDIPHPNNPHGTRKMPISEFITEFTHWPGFVTCLIFSVEVWKLGMSETCHYDGYNFLSRIYNGSKNKNACFIASPIILQRRGIQSWKKFWPQYWLVSMPKLLANLEANNITSGALAMWQLKEVTTKRFIIDCFVAKAYKYPITSSFWYDTRKYQASVIRKIGSIIIQYMIPSFFAKFLYSKTKKMT